MTTEIEVDTNNKTTLGCEEETAFVIFQLIFVHHHMQE